MSAARGPLRRAAASVDVLVGLETRLFSCGWMPAHTSPGRSGCLEERLAVHIPFGTPRPLGRDQAEPCLQGVGPSCLTYHGDPLSSGRQWLGPLPTASGNTWAVHRCALPNAAGIRRLCAWAALRLVVVGLDTAQGTRAQVAPGATWLSAEGSLSFSCPFSRARGGLGRGEGAAPPERCGACWCTSRRWLWAPVTRAGPLRNPY